ncbi:hypothetical protein KJ761_00275 [Patescibacteria group bacterium]|nr:hypothetical protein [Patescibacteria group bacterium]
MNIIKASKMIGGLSVTEGFWKNVMVAVGLVGAAVMLGLLFVLKSGFVFALLIIFIVMSSLGLYIPSEYVYGCIDARRESDFLFSRQNKNCYPPSELNERHKRSCRKCQNYYQTIEREYFRKG